MPVKINKAAKSQTVEMEKSSEKGKVFFVQKVIKGDTYLVMAGPELAQDDEFQDLYIDASGDSVRQCLPPPFEPRKLKELCRTNNILFQCCEAMVVNIDGTGYELPPLKNDDTPDEKEVKRIKNFLDEPYPGESILTIRKKIRMDKESIGWGCMEVLRTLDNTLIGLRHVPAETIRWVKLDKAIQVEKTLVRDGKEHKIKIWDRERRYVQRLGRNIRYFKEYGASRHLHMDTGEWETAENPVPIDKRASELKVYGQVQDTYTNYPVPRWLNNLPSVIGSRKAEEHNLEFFDAGGMPPAIIFIEGGMLAKDMADTLRMYLSGQAKSRHRAAVVEAQSSTGTLDSAGKVSVKVERFGAESVKDGMFQNYDKNCEEHVRVSFRLPPLFIGRSNDYNFASAQVSYMIAEAQVFGPERADFDEDFNLTIMRELGAKTCKFKSNPIILKASQDQIAALTLAKDYAKGNIWMREVNSVSGLNLEFDQKKEKAQLQKLLQPVAQPGQPGQTKPSRQVGAKDGPKLGGTGSKVSSPNGTKKIVPGAPGKKSATKTTKIGVRKELVDLSTLYLTAEGLLPSEREFSEDEKVVIRKMVDDLGDERELFNQVTCAQVDAFALEE